MNRTTTTTLFYTQQNSPSLPSLQEGEQAEQAVQGQEIDSEPEWTQVEETQKRRLAQACGRSQGSKNKAKQDTVRSHNIKILLKESQVNTASQEC